MYSEIYIVHSPTNALLLNLEKFKIYIKIHTDIALIYYHQGPCTEPGYSYIYVKTLSKISSLYVIW